MNPVLTEIETWRAAMSNSQRQARRTTEELVDDAYEKAHTAQLDNQQLQASLREAKREAEAAKLALLWQMCRYAAAMRALKVLRAEMLGVAVDEVTEAHEQAKVELRVQAQALFNDPVKQTVLASDVRALTDYCRESLKLAGQ